jgi:NADH-quinone oxidoreductase subunit L
LPLTFWTFLLGSASLAALPLVTAGFYSKDLILWLAWSSEKGSPWLWSAGAVGAFLTSLYTFRMVFLTFFGNAKSPVRKRPGLPMQIPLVILAFLSVVAGCVELPDTLGGLKPFSAFLQTVLPPAIVIHDVSGELLFQVIASLLSLVGLSLACLFFLRTPRYSERLTQTRLGSAIHRFWFSGWRFDELYDTVFVMPFLWAARINRDDFIDLIYGGIAWFSTFFHGALSLTQTGKVRWYAMGIAIGAVIMIGIVVFS